MSVITQTQIANRVCQKVGAELIAAGALLTEDSKQANEIRNCYDILRRSELRRRVWRFSIRKTALRPIGLTTKQLTFATYAAGTTYAQNDIVIGDDGQTYFSRVAGNIGNTPSTSPTDWTLYFGPDVATEFITTWGSGFTYSLYDHAIGSDGASYISLVNNNTNYNPVGDGGVHWMADSSSFAMATNVSFFAGELVHIGNTVYLSLTNNNGQGTVNTVPQNYITGLPPPNAITWLTLTAQPAVAPMNFIYPLGAGPNQDQRTKNVYRLPVGWLREAPQDPKAGGALYLGAPDGSKFEDWNYEGNYFTSDDNAVIPYRFAADIQNVMEFDPLFVEGFVCRMGFEVCEPLTQSSAKKSEIGAQYKQFMTEAGLVNGLDNGPVYPPEDSYITTRL